MNTSNSKKKLVKPATPTSWTEPTVEQIIGAMRDMHDTLVKVNQGPVDINRGTIFCHSEQDKERAEEMLRENGYVEVAKDRWEKQ